MRFFLRLFLFFSGLVLYFNANASHMMGADISYECLGNNQYRITLNIYRDCSGITMDADYEVTIESASCGAVQTLNLAQTGATGLEVSPLCPAQLSQSTCNGGTLPGVQQYTYQGVVTLNQQCSDWIISTTDFGMCCRNSTITNLTNPDFEDLHVRALLNNTNGQCNNAPVFTTLPVPYICNGQVINYNHGTVDLDGDSLYYILANPLTSNGATIGYNGGLSPTGPLNTLGQFQFDDATGQMTFTPAGQQVAVIAVIVEEYRNGVLIGSVMRDIQVVVLNCNNNLPTSTPLPQNVSGGTLVNNRIEVCPGQTVSFQFTATDPNPTDILTVTDNASVAAPGSTISYTGTGNSVTGTFTWTPSAANTGTNVVTVTVEDNACPTIGTNSFSYTIEVLQGTTAGPDVVYCSNAGPIQLNAIGGSQFTWTPAAGLSCTNCPNPLATPSVTTTYIVQSNLSSLCKNRDTITITVAPNFAIEAGTDATICLNAIHQINATLGQNGAPYTIEWLPATGLSANNILNPVASPLTSTTYVLSATSAQGCTLRDSLRVNISGVAPSITAFAEPDTVCPGANTVLNFSVLPRQCGLAASPCINGNTPITVGTGTTTTTNGTPYDGFWHDGRVQMLFRATELTALGMTAGTINTISWNIATKGSTIPYNNFTIKMGCTSLTALTANYTPNLVTVLSPTTYTTVTGWNLHNLTTGYEWDGVSNLIIEICYDNTDYTQADAVQHTVTAFNSVIYRNVDNSAGCNLTAPTVTTERPNTRFGFCSPTLNNATITWSAPSTALVQSPNAQQTSAQVLGTTTFIVDVSQGACAGQGFVTVVADTTIQLTAGPDTALCSPASIQLFANAVGTPGPIALTCGANGRTCSAANATTYTVGTNGGVTTSTSPFRGQEQEGRLQILLRSSELNAAGITRGIIRSIQFNVATKNSSVAFNQFTVRMGCTNQTTLSNTFLSGLTQVFNPKPINTIAGWNSFALDNTYDWDGLSNLVIEICFTNTGNNNNDIIAYTQTTYNSVVSDAQSFVFTGGCNLNVAPQTSSFRPDIRMAICPPPPGQFSYTWTPSAGLSGSNISNPVFSGTSTSAYLVTVSDGTCFATDSVTIEYYNGYQTNIAGNNVGCNGANNGNLTSSPSGGVSPYDFSWSTGQNTTAALTDTVFNLGAGTYFLTVTDANGCTQIDTFILTVPPPLVLDVQSQNVTCFGYNNGSVLATTTGGTPPYNYLWSNGFTTDIIDSIGGGNYIVTVTDASGCVETDSAIVIEPDGIVFNSSSTTVSCFQGSDGTATVNIISGGTPPFTINWPEYFQTSTSQNSTVNNIPAGFVTFEIIDDSSCIQTDSVFVSERDSFVITAFVLQDASCYNTADGIATANVAGDTLNYTFSWITAPIVNNALAGSRPQGINEVQVTDTAGCTQSVQVVIGSPAQIELLGNFTSPTCYNGNNGSANVSILSGGVAPFSYLWSTGDTNSLVTNITSGEYFVTVTDANGCFEFDTVTLLNPDSFVISSIIKDVDCFGEANGVITIIANGGTEPYVFTWYNEAQQEITGNGNQITVSSGNYSVMITDAQLCSETISSLIVNEPSLLQLNYSTSNETCVGANDGTVTVSGINGTPPYFYTLYGISSTIPIDSGVSVGSFTGLSPDSYIVQVNDSNGCMIDSSLIIEVGSAVNVSFNPDSLQIRLGEETSLIPIFVPEDTTGYSFLWSPSTDLSCSECSSPIASPVVTTVYELTVVSNDGCSASANIIVGVDNNLILFVPNAFTPNNDGVNDLLQVFGISVKTVNFNVFNRWGEKVYGIETSDLSQGWDGTYLGKPLPPSVFTYYLDATFEDGQTKQLKGSVTLIR